MATKKISELSAITTPTSAALFPIVQSSTTVSVTLANIAANMPDLSATTLTTGTLTTTGNATIGGDLTITGDDLTMSTNTSGAALIADGTNFNPVVISGDISIGTTGTAAIGSGVIVNADVNASAAIAFSKMADLTASRALVSDGSGDVSVSAVTSTEIGYLDGVSSAIQTQLDGKASSTYVPTTITVADESTDTTCFPLFVTAATGDLPPKSGSNLAFNSNTGALTATSFVGNLTGNVTGNTSGSSGSCTGNAATATALATGREISLAGDVTASGVSFDGTGNISLSTTIAANSVALSTDTTGNYIAAVSGTTNEISVSGSGSEGATATIGLPDDVTIAGNLTVNGTTTSVDTTNLEVEDPLIKLAKNNSAADSLDIGFYGLYDTSGSQDLYSGLFRDANDSGKYKLFKDLQVEPTTTVNTSGTGYATGTLVATFEGNLTGNVTGNTSGTSGSTTGNAATATALQTARNIGGVSFNGTGNIDLPGVNSAGNQNTSGTAAGLSATLAVGSGGTGATTLTANGALIGNGTGAVTAVDMSTKGHILAGDGSGNPSALAVGTNNHVLTADSSEATGLKWSAVAGGTPTDITVADESTDTTCFPLFVTAATGDLGPKTGTNLAFNSSTGLLTATSFEGALDLNGAELVLDADADTSIHASTDDQIDIKVANSDVAKITSSGVSGNHIQVDMWRQTDTLSANNGVLGVDSTMERVDDATFAKIGTGMSVTSGKWAFPATGLYEIKVQAFWVCAAGDTAILQTQGSSDDGSNYDVLAWAAGGDQDNTKGSFYSQCFFNCTNTSTHKVKFNCISIGSGSELQGGTDYNTTSLSFIRLGDSQ